MFDPNAPLPAPMNPPQQPMPPRPVLPQPPKKKGGRNVLLLGCLAFAVIGVGSIAILVAMAGHVSVHDDAVLRIDLRGEVPEYAHVSGLDELFGPKVVTVRQHVLNLKKAAVDKRVKAVVMRIDPLLIGWAKVEELRDAMADYRKSGKPLIVYSEYFTEKEYALALGADEIVMPPDSRFELNGLAADYSHYPGLLEKLGIEVQYFRFGKYKSGSGEQFGRKAFTEPVKEMINENLSRTFNTFVDAVVKYRKVEREPFVALINESGSKAEWALEHKLIDKTMYWDELEDELRTKLSVKEKEKINYLSAAKYREVDAVSAGLPKGKHTFALIYSVGLIVAGKGGGNSPLSGGETQGADPIIAQLRRAADDENIKAIIFRVDSPGGAGLGCDYVRREVEKARAKKPVIVSMSDVAASGGYWVSMDATAIVAQPSTYTGSIGIFSVVPSLSGLYEKLDLNNETFKQGEHADAIMGARKMTEDEAKKFEADLYVSYKRFVELAGKGRGKTFDEMEPNAQGRTWLGAQALERGLVDKLGGFDAAIALGKEKAKIPEDEPVQLQLFDKKRTFLEELARQGEDDDDGPELHFADAVIKHAIDSSAFGPLFHKAPLMSPLVREVLSGRETLYPVMEYQLDVH